MHRPYHQACIAHIIDASSMHIPLFYMPHHRPRKLHSLRGLSVYNHRNLIGSWRHSSEYNHLRKFLRIVGLSFALHHYSQSSHLHSHNYQYLCIIAPPSSRPPCAPHSALRPPSSPLPAPCRPRSMAFLRRRFLHPQAPSPPAPSSPCALPPPYIN